jgi:TonB family protein
LIYAIVVALLLSLFPAQSPQPQDQDKPAQPPAEAPPRSKGTRVRMGGKVMNGQLTKKVAPKYPREAREQRIEGTVRLHVIISTDGKVQYVELVSGDPILAKSAVEAVRKWEYKPMLLNGEPVEVDTTVDVIFSLIS